MQTQGGLENSITTRFWLGLHVQHAAELLFAYLIDMLGASNVEWADEDIGIIVRKAAGNRTVYGTFIFTSNEAVTDGVGTLVVMKRTKVSSSLLEGECSSCTVGFHIALEGFLVGNSKGSKDRAVRRQERLRGATWTVWHFGH